MRKFFTLFFTIAAMISVQAQTWNASTMDAATYEENYVYEGLTIYASTERPVVIDENSKSAGDYSFTQRIKMGGSAGWTDATTPSGRVLGFDVTGNCTITVYVMSSNSSATDRYVAVYAGDNNTTLMEENVLPTSLAGYSATYTGDATTIFVASTNSGINIYGIDVSYGGTKSRDLKAANGKIVSTEYYSITGKRIDAEASNLPKGVYIKKVTFENGKIASSKVNRLF